MMKTLVALVVALAAATTLTASALAADPEVPFPAAQVKQVFIATQIVTTGGAMNNYFAPGSTVVFRAYAVDPKTRKVVAAKDMKYFYVTIPNQPNVKLKYDAAAPGASTGLPWTGTWTVPSTYPEGTVAFKVLIKLKALRKGQFLPMPVGSSILAISKLPPPVFGPGPGAGSAGTVLSQTELSLYVDSVNGTRPTGAAPRLIGCSQTNVFKRGEQFVLRAWGTDLKSGDILSSANVKEAHFSIAGQPNTTLNWGAHGSVGAKVWFWTNAWNIPADFPLGETTVHVVYTSEAGQAGGYDYVINIIP